MDNEQLMLTLFKQQQYNVTRVKLQKAFLIVSAASSTFGIFLTLIFYTDFWYVYVFAFALICVGINSILVWTKVLHIHMASIITMCCNCFLFIPGLWMITGIDGAAPMVSIVMLVAIITLFSGKLLKWLLVGFSIAMLALTIYSAVTEYGVTHNVTHLVYVVAAYIVTLAVIMLYMLSKQRELDKLNDKFLRNSFRDELTQFYNRKLLDLIIEHEEKLYRHNHIEYIFMMLDVDDFKQLNDEHGHVFGDIVLRSIAQCVQEKARASDFTVRYGGDEFLIIQANASDSSIKAFVDRIEAAIATSCQLDIPISVSYGYAMRSECDSPSATLKLADQRMFEHKATKKVGR